MQPGLYDKKGNLIKYWNELVDLGFNIASHKEKSCGEKIFKNNKLSGKLIVPPFVKTVGKGNFENCKNLTSIIFQGMVESVNVFAFKDCLNLESVVFEKSVKEIGLSAFSGCKNLKDVELGDKTILIHSNAFQMCEKLEKIVFPESLEEIKYFAFASCNSLTKINIPRSCQFLPTSFMYCSYLKRINIDNKNENFCAVDNVVFSKDMKKLLFYPSSKIGKIYKVPEGVETIGNRAFNESKLEKIILPDTLRELEKYAFVGSKKLTDINLPCNLKALSDYVFKNTNIKELTLPASLNDIDYDAFSDSNLKTVFIPEKLIDIGPDAFDYCSNLKEIHIAKNWANLHPEFSENYKEYLVFPMTIDEIIEASNSFKEINKMFKDKNVER